jgi:hypothetical protein
MLYLKQLSKQTKLQALSLKNTQYLSLITKIQSKPLPLRQFITESNSNTDRRFIYFLMFCGGSANETSPPGAGISNYI